MSDLEQKCTGDEGYKEKLGIRGKVKDKSRNKGYEEGTRAD